MEGENSVSSLPAMGAGPLGGEAFIFGNSDASFDDKSRLLFDKAKRAFLGKDFVLLWGELEQVVAYPKATWDAMIAELAGFGPNNFHLQQYVRLFVSHANTGCNFDGQGRIVVPGRLRELAGLEGRLMIVGGMFRVEIWTKAAYDESQKDPENYKRSRRESIERAYAKLQGEA